MCKYKWRNNCSVIVSCSEGVLKGKLAFKTINTDWLGTLHPIVIPISIHSNFHYGATGELKMRAFISTIRKWTKGKITILMTELAHVNVLSNHNLRADAEELAIHFCEWFKGCHLTYWHELIHNDPNYHTCKKQIRALYESSEHFRALIHADALSTYKKERAQDFPDQKLYIEKAIIDLLEQTVALKILSMQGFRFLFYPGKQYPAHIYFMQHCIPQEKQLVFVDVFLTIEKKVWLNHLADVVEAAFSQNV